MTAPEAHGPVHQPGTFNIEVFIGGCWHGGMNRLTRESAIDTARCWAEQDGHRHRVFDLDGKVIFDTDHGAVQVDVLAELRTMRKRFVNCAMHNGSDKEFAEGACEDFDAAVAAVSELIAADQELEAAYEAFPAVGRCTPAQLNEAAARINAAQHRRRAALARCGGRK